MPSVSRRFGGYVKVKRKPRPNPRTQADPPSGRTDDPLVGERAAAVGSSFLAPKRASPPLSAWQRLRLPLFIGLAMLAAVSVFILAARSDKSYLDASSLSASARSNRPAYIGAARREGGGSGSSFSSSGSVSHAQAFLAANLAKHGGKVEASEPNARGPGQAAAAVDGNAGYRHFKNDRCEISSETPAGAAESMSRCLSLGKTEGR